MPEELSPIKPASAQNSKDFQPMSNREAQEEANLMRVLMGQDPESGFVKTFLGEDSKKYLEREPTSLDYDRALKIIERMKLLTENETDFQKFCYGVAQFVNFHAESFMFSLILRSMPVARIGFTQDFFKDHARVLERFKNAEERLKDLKEKAKYFGQKQAAIEAFKNDDYS